MGDIGTTLGSSKQSTWSAPTEGESPLQVPVDVRTASSTTSQAQGAIQQQLDFLTALQAQKGISNQSDVYNQLSGVAAGKGPNPAQAMLNQATGANVSNQAALMAGQRGSGANAGLIARQAAMQGGSLQQQAAAQGASMQANQSLNALAQMGGIAGQQVGQQANATTGYNQAIQSEQQNLLNAIAQSNQSQAAMQSSRNTSNEAIAAQNNKSAQSFLGTIGSGIGQLFAQGGQVGAPSKMYADGGTIQPSSVSSIPPANPAITRGGSSYSSNVGNYMYGSAPSSSSAPTGGGSMSNMPATTPTDTAKSGISLTQLLGANHILGLEHSVGNAIKNIFSPQAAKDASDFQKVADQARASADQAADKESKFQETAEHGAEIEDNKDAEFQNVADEGANASDMADAGIATSGTSGGAEATSGVEGAEAAEGASGMEALFEAKGGKVPAMVSPGEVYLPPKKVKEVAKGANPVKAGEKIPGKAKVKGDSYANDTVPKNLESGGIVIPKSVMESDDPSREAAKFVAAILRRKGSLPRSA